MCPYVLRVNLLDITLSLRLLLGTLFAEEDRVVTDGEPTSKLRSSYSKRFVSSIPSSTKGELVPQRQS